MRKVSTLLAAVCLTLAGLPVQADTSVGYSNVFSIDNNAGDTQQHPPATETRSPYSNSATSQLLRGQLHLHSIEDIDKLAVHAAIPVIARNPVAMALAWMKSTYNRGEVAIKYGIPGHYDFLAITDHDYFIQCAGAGIWDPGVDSTQGIVWARRSTELTPFEVNSVFPHVLAIGLNAGTSVNGLWDGVDSRTDWYTHVGRRIEHVKANGGLALIAHPNDKGKKLGVAYDLSVKPERLRYLYDHYTPDGIAINNAQDLWNSALRAGYNVWGYAEDDFHPNQGFPVGGKAWVGVPGTSSDSWSTIKGKLGTGNYYSYWFKSDRVAGDSRLPGMKVTHTMNGGHPLIRAELNGYSENVYPRFEFIHAKGSSTPTYSELTELPLLDGGGVVHSARADYQCKGYERFVRVYAELAMTGGRTLCVASQPVTIAASDAGSQQSAFVRSQSTSAGLNLRYLTADEKPGPPLAGYIGDAFDVTADNGTIPPGATLQLSFDGEDISAIGGTQYLAIYYYQELPGEWVRVGGSIDPGAATIEGGITELGKYCISADLPADTTAPEVWIDNPPYAASVPADTTVKATVNDDLGAWRVKFGMNGHLLLEDADSSDGWGADLKVSDYCTGDWTLKAEAEDLAGNTGTAEIPIYISSTTPRPTVSITSHHAGAVLSGTATILGTCWDDVSVADVMLYADDTLIGYADLDGSGGWSAQVDTTYLADGNRVLKAVVEDYPGNSAAATLPVAISSGAGAGPMGALKGSEDGAMARFSGAVVVAGSSLVDNGFYAESADRTCGVRVIASQSVNVGDSVSVVGTVSTLDGERVVQAGDVLVSSSGGGIPKPLFVRGAQLLRPPDSLGKMVTVCGQIASIDQSSPPRWFILNDASGNVKCVTPAGVTPPAAGFVTVTGVCSLDGASGSPVVLVRDAQDVRTIGNGN